MTIEGYGEVEVQELEQLPNQGEHVPTGAPNYPLFDRLRVS